MNRTLLTVVLVICCLVQPAFAWCTKEHILITRTAVRELLASDTTPAAMKQWLREAQPRLLTMDEEKTWMLDGHTGIYPRGVDGLAFWAVMPDLIADSAVGKTAKVAPFGVPEPQLHFVDLEYLNSDESLRSFSSDLSHKPKLSDVPRDMKDPRWEKAGMLPFRVENCFNDTVTAMKAGKLIDKPGQFPRDEHATKYAGMLAHYAADNWMPLHATADYQAYSFFPKAEKKPKVHFDLEYRLTDDDKEDYPELRERLWQAYVSALPVTEAPELKEDVWTASLKVSMAAYDSIPMVGKAAQNAYLDANGNVKGFDAPAFFGYTDSVYDTKLSVLQLKAMMMARAVKWTETLWLRAWEQAHSPAQ